MAKKKYDPNDFTNQDQAMNQGDVNSQDAKTRLWQSLNYSYGKQRDESDKSFDRNISQQDNAALARGMGRSSYNEQIRANLLNDKTKAQNDIYAAQIADYQSRIGQLEQQEKEDERWERQYADQRADTAWNQGFQQSQLDWQKSQADQQMAYQKERDAIADAFNEKQFQANRSDTAWNQNMQTQQFDWQKNQAEQQLAYQRERDAIGDALNERQFQANREDTAWSQNMQSQQFDWQKNQADQQLAYQRERDAVGDALNERQFQANRADTAWSQNMQSQQFDWQRGQAEQQMAYQKERDAIADAYNERQWQAQQDQWRQEFDYNAKTNEQKIAFDIVTAALAAGNDADDATLAKAGISRAEYNSMKKKASSGGKGSIPDWKKAGYPSKEAYEAAQALAKSITDQNVEVEPNNTNPLYNMGFKRTAEKTTISPDTQKLMQEIWKKNSNGG